MIAVGITFTISKHVFEVLSLPDSERK